MKKSKLILMVGAADANETGAVLVEAAIGLSLLLYLLLVGFDLVRVSAELNAAQWVASKTARWSSYANLTVEGKSKAEVVKDYALRVARSAGLSLDPSHIKICSARFAGCESESVLEPGDLYVLRIRKKVSIASLLGVSFISEAQSLDQREPSI